MDPRGDAQSSPSDPRALYLLVAALGTATVAWSAELLTHVDANPRGWAITGFLAALAIGFEEATRRVAKLQIRLRSQVRADMTSVWVVAAGLALAPARAVVLLVVLYVYLWFRQSRPSGELAHRKIYNACSNIVAALAAGYVFRAVDGAASELPFALSGAVAVFAAIIAALLVGKVLITAALFIVGVRGRALLASLHDNLIEVATICLGGLVALAVQYQPWLVLLVLLPMVTLQRGAVVRDLEAAAITDAKTGLLNAIAWEQLAKRELQRATRQRTKLAVLIIDIDRFKVVNDRFGHLVGDKVLAGIARSVREALRDYDGLGRFGGEEFVAVLPDADERAALVVAERVRLRVNQLRVLDLVPTLNGDGSGRGEARLSVSIGVSVLHLEGGELPELLHAADQALYRAKWNGRNQVQLARRGDQLPDMVEL